MEGSVVVNKVRDLKAGEGLNAATGEYGDLIKAGVIDPTMVTRSALQNAASIAKNILVTEAIIAEPPEEGGAGGGMPRRHAGHGRHDVATPLGRTLASTGEWLSRGPARRRALSLRFSGYGRSRRRFGSRRAGGFGVGFFFGFGGSGGKRPALYSAYWRKLARRSFRRRVLVVRG